MIATTCRRPKCSAPLHTTTLCRGHARKLAEYSAARYELLKQNGICTYCGHKRATPEGGQACTKCRVRKRVYDTGKRTEYRHKFMAVGKCRDCGKRRVPPGRTRCKACLLTHNNDAKAKRLYWSDQGLCCRCGGDRQDQAFKTCQTCRDYYKACYKRKANFASSHPIS